MPRHTLSKLLTLLVLLTLLWGCGGSGGGERFFRNEPFTYLALGDSLAYGYDTATTTVASTGDRGYAKYLADRLAEKNGGLRPTLVNLGIPAEGSTTFMQGGKYLGWNLTYSMGEVQFSKMKEVIATAQAEGRPVRVVTFNIGINDVYDISERPGFFEMDEAQLAALRDEVIGKVDTFYGTVLTELRESVPDAIILLPDHYDLLRAHPSHPLYNQAGLWVDALNEVVDRRAKEFKARRVRVRELIEGHESEYTNVAVGDPHPNAAGYAAIGERLTQRF